MPTTSRIGSTVGALVVVPLVMRERTASAPLGRIDIGDDDNDHLISPEDRFRLAIAKH